ncbi:hypothetical protein BD410DRAFT_787137 [Rickenella mellea]|uniref:F-box domain-containing protein n=1 Tax=Rickenella mellea TaxID=50990 RepID=A0A4Y7Q9S1_9AGAM|nr:hypothetical protein BD410DRAFT_787137 [Rickenella mellea]
MAKRTSIRHLLNTTRVPTAAEADTVRQIIEESYGELSKLRNQVDAFRNKLSNLLAKCELLEKRIEVHEAIVAPIRRLPQEVLSEIFLHCLPSRDNDLNIFPFKEAPLLLCRVCSYWRVIARRTPPLWSTLTISNPYSYYEGRASFSGEAMGATKWISESGSRPFSVQVEFARLDEDLGYYADNEYENGVNGVLSAIENSSHLWTSVIGDAPHGAISRLIALMNSGKTPLLQKFDLTRDGHAENYFDTLKMSDLSMRVISIHGMTVVPDFDGATLLNIHTLCLTGSQWSYHSLSMDIFWECMTYCPNLQSLTLRIGKECQTPIHIVEHSHLEVCTLYFMGDVDPGPSLDRLSLPMLSKLAIFMEHGSQVGHWPHLAELLDRSRSQVTHLRISGLHMSDHNFGQVLQSAPHLVSLRVHEFLTTEEIIKALTVKEQSKCLCPRLETIYFSGCEGVAWQSVRDMILSRWGGLLAKDDDRSNRHPGMVLQEIVIHTRDREYRTMAAVDADIQQCIRDGLELSGF